jgi:hypothetical protein
MITVGGGDNALFRDKELQLTGVCRAERAAQSLSCSHVPNEVDVAIEVDAEGFRANASHRGDRRKIPFLAAPHQHHGGAIPGGFDHLQGEIRGGQFAETIALILISASVREQECHLAAVSRRVIEQRLDQ